MTSLCSAYAIAIHRIYISKYRSEDNSIINNDDHKLWDKLIQKYIKKFISCFGQYQSTNNNEGKNRVENK